MFTGIIEEVGRIQSIKRGAKSAVLHIAATTVTDGLHIGDSVAVNGVCLTATSLTPQGFTADAMPETLSRSSLGTLAPGSPVNLERAVQIGSRLGGHIVSGHIDCCATITGIQRDDNALWFTLAAPRDMLRYVIEKGSVALDGVSLTVARVDDNGFAVSLIPHTAAMTTFGTRRVGDTVNLECDVIGKYVEKLLLHQADTNNTSSGGITADFLTKCGF